MPNMPRRSEEEKRARKLLFKQKLEARKLAKEKKKEQEHLQKKASVPIDANSETAPTDDKYISQNTGECMFLTFPDDVLRRLSCYLAARDLGVMSMCSKHFNLSMNEIRISHFLSRMQNYTSFLMNSKQKCPIDPWKLNRTIKMCENEAEARVSATFGLGRHILISRA